MEDLFKHIIQTNTWHGDLPDYRIPTIEDIYQLFKDRLVNELDLDGETTNESYKEWLNRQ